MARKSLQALTLLRATDTAGGMAALARRLAISQTTLKLYLEDLQPVPELVFLRAVDVLADDQAGRLSNSGKKKGNGKGLKV